MLDRLSCTFNQDESVAIVGASGVGKTTLLHIIGTLERPTSGKVIHFGNDLSKLSDKDLSSFRNREIGFVFQFHHLLPEFTALENVIMPCNLAEEDIDKCCQKAHELLAFLGLEDKKDLNVKKLSGGEQQRVALARALIKSPRLILADEPTGNLDERSGLKVAQLLFEIRKNIGATLIIVTHNLNLARMTDRCIGLRAGKTVDVPKEKLAEFIMDEAT